MVQKIQPRGVIWVPSIPPHAGHLSEKNDNLAVQYEDVHASASELLKTMFFSSSARQHSETKLQKSAKSEIQQIREIECGSASWPASYIRGRLRNDILSFFDVRPYFWKNSCNRFNWIYFWWISALWNHCGSAGWPASYPRPIDKWYPLICQS